MNWLNLAPLIVLCYTLGSIPFGYLIAKAKGIDITKTGSGNTGATNVGRVLGFWWFLTVLVLDASKGFVSVVVPRNLLGYSDHSALLFAGASILGHMTSPFLRFRGGKGVATGIGAIFGLDILTAAAAFFAWLSAFLAARMVSLASLVAALVMPCFFAASYGLNNGNIYIFLFLTITSILVIIRHRANIIRILNGTEPKVDL